MWRNEFLKPFAHSVWILILIFIILISILIKVAFIFHGKTLGKQMTGSSSFLMAFGAICNQGKCFGVVPRALRQSMPESSQTDIFILLYFIVEFFLSFIYL